MSHLEAQRRVTTDATAEGTEKNEGNGKENSRNTANRYQVKN
jgi:hypothetical protein